MMSYMCFLLFGLAAGLLDAKLGVQFDKRATSLPILTLPYGRFQASSYNSNSDVYVFKNIRFAAPPTGNLRCTNPTPPVYNATLSDGSYGPACIQAPAKGENMLGPGDELPFGLGGTANQFLGGVPVPSSLTASEDCLFLDVYVPASALNNSNSKIPVINWFYGGAYIFGAKDASQSPLPYYDGTGLIQASHNSVIFVASNYRLGAYGWLACDTMEKEGLPNVGLYDQRAALEWTQSYIHLLGGDPSQVSAWGESAGAGSIMHHLISFGGTQDPLFSRAVLQSPAYQYKFDRRGTLEQTFRNFTALAGCAGQGVSCLQAASAATLNAANTAIANSTPDGTFAFGPSSDGDLIRQLAPLEYAAGHYWKGINSIVLSHVEDEADVFVDGQISTDSQFNHLVDNIYPPYAKVAGVNAAIESQYPPVLSGTGTIYLTETDRVKAFLSTSDFVCNVCFVADAYSSVASVYNLQYSVIPGYHATDLLPTFYNLNLNLTAFGLDNAYPLVPGFGGLAQAYQAYLTSQARSGSPNTYALAVNIPPTIDWPTVSDSGDAFGGVLNVGDTGFTLITDEQNTKSICGFWEQVAAAVTDLGGYAPPGSVVNTTLVMVTNNETANYGS